MANTSTDSTGSIARQLLRFSLPLIFSGILQQLYSWADAFIVGNTDGETALAAIGSTTTAVNFYITTITGFTLGLAILFAQNYGGRNYSVIPKLLSTFSLTMGGAFLILAIVGIVFTPQFLLLLHTTKETIDLAVSYLQVVLCGIPFLAVYNVYSAALRGLGNSRAPFYSVLLSSIANVILDILFVACFHWGVTGAALATVFSQATMTVYLLAYSIKKYSLLRFSLNRSILDRSLWVQGCRFGLPPMIQSSVSAFGSLILQNFMNGFGTATVAAITTAYRVDSIVMIPIVNLSSGISTLSAQYRGGGERKKAKRVFLAGLLLMAGVSLLLTFTVIPTGGKLISLFGAGQEAVKIGSDFFQRIAVFYLVFGAANAIRGYLEGMSFVNFSSFAGIFTLVCRIIASYAMKPFFGNMVIAWAEVFSWLVLLLLYTFRVILFFIQSRKQAWIGADNE